MPEEVVGKKVNKGCLVFIVLIAVIFFIGFIQIVYKMSNSDTTSTSSNVIMSGDNGRIDTATYLALNENYYDEMINYFNAKNTDALTRMEARGDIIFLPVATQVTVINRGVLKTEVEVISTGQRGYVISDFISK